MNTSSYLYGVGPLFKDSVIIQAWQEREGELKLTNSEVELWNERGSCEARYRDTHSLLVEGTSLQVCSSGRSSVIKGKKVLDSTTNI